MNPVIHALEGRVRLKLAEIKGNSHKARRLEAYLTGVNGVETVSANPMTGSVLIFYQPHILSQKEIIRSLVRGGNLGSAPPPESGSAFPGTFRELGGRLALAMVEAVLTGLFVRRK